MLALAIILSGFGTIVFIITGISIYIDALKERERIEKDGR